MRRWRYFVSAPLACYALPAGPSNSTARYFHRSARHTSTAAVTAGIRVSRNSDILSTGSATRRYLSQSGLDTTSNHSGNDIRMDPLMRNNSLTQKRTRYTHLRCTEPPFGREPDLAHLGLAKGLVISRAKLMKSSATGVRVRRLSVTMLIGDTAIASTGSTFNRRLGGRKWRNMLPSTPRYWPFATRLLVH